MSEDYVPDPKDPDHKFSYWQIFELYKKCPYSYELAFEKRLRGAAPPGKLMYKQLLGAAFHMAMEWKTRRNLTWPQVIHLSEYWMKKSRTEIDNSATSDALVDEVQADLHGVLTAVSGSDHAGILEAINLTETPIKGQFIGFRLGGRPDGIGDVEGIPIAIRPKKSLPDDKFCVDYKLSDKPNSNASRQICFYSLSTRIDYGYVYYPVPNIMKTIRLNQKRKDEMLEEVKSIVDGIRSGNRKPNHKACSYCFHLDVCDKAAFGARAKWEHNFGD